MSLHKFIAFAGIALLAVYVVYPGEDPDDPDTGWLTVWHRERRRSITYRPPQGKRSDGCPHGQFIQRHHKLVTRNPDQSFTAVEACQYTQDNRRN